ncbi:hypothetical protein CPB86DRAFT_213135 [Serendipita vermifera]|nr:hypothetical protein CPB86DRAFT_213135 [Serendipita vermifera]
MLPPEICQIILQYSVLVTDFLDPDHILDRLPPWVINSRGWSNSTEYSRTESTINTLRRVCRSWEEYLRPYVHRFVRMPDVVHGFVPAERLRSAMRISLGDHGGSYCSACKPEQFSLVGVAIPEENHHEQYWELCRQIIVHEQPLKTEILDYGLYGRHILEKLVSRRTFPRLAHIQAMWQTHTDPPNYRDYGITSSVPTYVHSVALESSRQAVIGIFYANYPDLIIRCPPCIYRRQYTASCSSTPPYPIYSLQFANYG